MASKFIRIAAWSGALAVLFGAFGAHALKGMITPEHLSIYDTASKYQFIHGLALLGCGILYEKQSNNLIKLAGASFVAGIILFSGSLYAIALSDLFGSVNIVFLGPVTPVGGMMFVIGWLCLAFSQKTNKITS